ncbi:MAG: hypothetical protein AAF646_00495 [Pseudomonadota bacterium]
MRLAYERDTLLDANAALPLGHLQAFGRGVGFCAEFNDMVKAFASCLSQKTRLCHQTPRTPKGITVCRGWEDYFEPAVSSLDNPFAMLNAREWSGRRYAALRPALRALMRQRTGCTTFMFDPIAHERPTTLTIEALDFEGEFETIATEVSRHLWRLNEETNAAVEMAKRDITETSCDLALHVRRGDKRQEFSYVPVEMYLDALRPFAGAGKRLFVASDDPTTCLDLQDRLTGDFDVVTSAGPADHSGRTEAGYDQASFNTLPPSTRHRQVVELLAEVEIMRRAGIFIGASTSNVFITLRRLRGDAPTLDLTQGAWGDRQNWRRF